MSGGQNSATVSVPIEDTGGFPGTHTAHLSQNTTDELSADFGDTVTASGANVVSSVDAYVGDRGDRALSTGSTFWQGQELGFEVADSQGIDEVQVRTVDEGLSDDRIVV